MQIDLFTDASHSRHTHVAGWAMMCCFNGKSVKRAGPTQGLVDCATQAEIIACVVGLHLTLKEFPGATEIVLYTDSMSAIRIISKTSWNWNRDKYKPHVETFWKLAGEVKIGFEHVYGHQLSRDRLAVNNNMCDSAARNARRREEVKRGLVDDPFVARAYQDPSPTTAQRT